MDASSSSPNTHNPFYDAEVVLTKSGSVPLANSGSIPLNSSGIFPEKKLKRIEIVNQTAEASNILANNYPKHAPKIDLSRFSHSEGKTWENAVLYDYFWQTQ